MVEKLIVGASKVISFCFSSKDNYKILGEAIGCENPFLYKVEVDFFKHKSKEVNKGELVYLSLENKQGAVGIIINVKQLLNKKWLTVYLLEDLGMPLKINLKNNELYTSTKTIFSKNNAVYPLSLDDIESDTNKSHIEKSFLYQNRDRFIGYVIDGSNINTIRFQALVDDINELYKSLKEGAVIKTKIHDQEVLYQIIDGKTNEEELEKHNVYGYLSGIAKKLGRYNYSNQELEIVKWLPEVYSPIFFHESVTVNPNSLAIGKLPETNLEIILKDPDALVSHNTAILGILGIGKSCLTFELIKKTIDNTEAKIVCIDITNEYKEELKSYIDASVIKEELEQATLDELKQNNNDGSESNPESWGNEKLYSTKLSEEISKFYDDDKLRILTINPDWHRVSKAGSQFKIQHKVDLTLAEKTRIISERIFLLAKNKWDESTLEDRKNAKAKLLIVFEEAHSLIPEWNSTANPGDQSASNGTAKVILQGRKYGLGSFVITQRTANISKSILNQCNTIFAMRVFDDTGKQFLENYIGTDYSNTLPTLEERHAIAVGKALKLKQPVIVRLNNREDVIITRSS